MDFLKSTQFSYTFVAPTLKILSYDKIVNTIYTVDEKAGTMSITGKETLNSKGQWISDKEEKKGLFGLRKDRFYILTKLKPSDDSLPVEEASIIRELFSKNDEVTINGEYDEDIANVVSAYQTNLKMEYSYILKEGRNRLFLILPIVLITAFVASIAYFFRFEPESHQFALLAAISGSFFVIGILSAILKAIFPKSKVAWFRYVLGSSIAIGALSLPFLFPNENLSFNLKGFAFVFPIVIIVYYIYDYLIKKPGKKKILLQSHIKGLKMYIDTAEEKRLQYFNPPQVTPEVFEAILPYAIALNMGQIWGEKFEKILLSSTNMPKDYQPTWYGGTFINPANIGRSLNSSLANTLNHSTLKPSSDNSGGNWSSGSFGGGFSGMGGGGGGVGGW